MCSCLHSVPSCALVLLCFHALLPLWWCISIGSLTVCSALQLGTTNQDLKVARSPLTPLTLLLEATSLDVIAIKNPVDLKAPSAPTSDPESPSMPLAPLFGPLVRTSSPLRIQWTLRIHQLLLTKTPLIIRSQWLLNLPHHQFSILNSFQENLTLPSTGPSGISLSKACKPELVEKMTSHRWTFNEYKITNKIERLLPQSPSLSHTPASVPTLTPAWQQWINTLSNWEYSINILLDICWWSLWASWPFKSLQHCKHPIYKARLELHYSFLQTSVKHRENQGVEWSNMLNKTPPPSFIWDIGKGCDMPLVEVSQDSPFWVLHIIIEGYCHYMVSSKAFSMVPWVFEFQILLPSCNVSTSRTPHSLNFLNPIFNMKHPSPHSFIILKLTYPWHHATTGELGWAGVNCFTNELFLNTISMWSLATGCYIIHTGVQCCEKEVSFGDLQLMV